MRIWKNCIVHHEYFRGYQFRVLYFYIQQPITNYIRSIRLISCSINRKRSKRSAKIPRQIYPKRYIHKSIPFSRITLNFPHNTRCSHSIGVWCDEPVAAIVIWTRDRQFSPCKMRKSRALAAIPNFASSRFIEPLRLIKLNVCMCVSMCVEHTLRRSNKQNRSTERIRISSFRLYLPPHSLRNL